MDINLVDENYYCGKPAIDPRLQDKSCEFSALAMALYCFPDEALSTLVKHEHPDFISLDCRFGLEVTEADNELHKQASKEFYKSLHPKEGCDLEKSRKIINRTGAKVIEYPERSLSTLDFSMFGDKMLVTDLKERVLKKESKEYDETKELYLAIVFFEILGTNSMNLINETLNDIVDSKTTKFKRIYVVTNQFCMMFQTENKSVITRNITRSEYHKIRTLGRMTAEGIVDLKSNVWTE